MTSQNRPDLHLTARGPKNEETQTELVNGSVLRVGRSPKTGWIVPWDLQISREHADLNWSDGRLTVTCTESAANPIIWNGRPQREIVVGPGDTFRIGTTEFRLALPSQSPAVARATKSIASVSNVNAAMMTVGLTGEDDEDVEDLAVREFPIQSGIEPAVALVSADQGDVEEYSYGVDDLQHVQFADPIRQMELLSNLPRMITSAESDTELALKLAGLLLNAIPQAVAVAVVQFDDTVVTQLRKSASESSELPKPRLMRVQTRDSYDGRFVPSRRLLARLEADRK